MSMTCAMMALNCPHCSSLLVRVSDDGREDQAVCPICWAAAAFEEAQKDINALRRGSRIDPKIKYLVDRVRFPRTPESPGV